VSRVSDRAALAVALIVAAVTFALCTIPLVVPARVTVTNGPFDAPFSLGQWVMFTMPFASLAFLVAAVAYVILVLAGRARPSPPTSGFTRALVTTDAPAAIGPYAQAWANAELIFCSGQIALDPQTGELVGGSTREQTNRVLNNLAAVLRAGGSDLRHVLKTTVYLTDLGDFAEMNAAYAEAFGGHAPARATVQVSALPRGAKVEIDCIATRTT
jgi:2-iminobutanoate/2-iminopropanoate deaminase